MPKITIQGTVINFPDSGASPNWAPAVVEFAEAVSAALGSVTGSYDVPPQVLQLPNEINTNISIPRLSFPSTEVRSVVVTYAIYRKSTDTIEVEAGELEFVFNSDSNQWLMNREGVGTDVVNASFHVTGSGQVQLSTTAMVSGAYEEGALSYQAKAILKSEA